MIKKRKIEQTADFWQNITRKIGLIKFDIESNILEIKKKLIQKKKTDSKHILTAKFQCETK